MKKAFARTAPRILAVALAAMTFMAVAAPAEAVTRDERDVAWRINHEHYKRRIRSLALWEGMSNTARAHACAMARAGRLYHTPNLGSKYRGWRILGENVAVGWDLYQIHLAWMRSASHRANILEWRYRGMGVGICRDSGGNYWVATHFYG